MSSRASAYDGEMEKAQRDAKGRDDERASDRQEASAARSDRNRNQGAGDGGAPVSATSQAADMGWEAELSLLAAMGIVIAPRNRAAANAGPDGGGGLAKSQAQPGVVTPPQGQTQGRVTPEVKKDLQNKEEHKAKAGAAPGGQAATPHVGAPGAPKPPPPSAGAPVPPGAGDDLDDSEARNVDKLITLLETASDALHRSAAAHALGKLRSSKARAALEKAARDSNPTVAKAATSSLAAL